MQHVKSRKLSVEIFQWQNIEQFYFQAATYKFAFQVYTDRQASLRG